MIEFIWKFKIQNTISYDIDTQYSNIIKTLGWDIIGFDSEYTNKKYTISGCIDFDISILKDFIPITEITNDVLQNWVENRVGVDKINIMKLNIIEKIKNLPNDWNPI